MHKRLSLLGAILLSLFAALPITGRDFHLSLNQVPILADSVAQKLYITLEPTAPAQLKATLSWDAAYTAAKLNGQPLTATPRNFVIDDWHKPTHSLTLTDAKGGESRWTLSLRLSHSSSSKHSKKSSTICAKRRVIRPTM